MRILRVTQKTYPDVKGGAPYHTYAMSRDQAEMGHHVTLLTVRQNPELPHIEEREGYTIVRYDPVASPLGNDISPGLAQYLADAEEFDVIHAHSHLYSATNLAALKRRLGDIPLAITNHGLFSQNAPEWIFDLYLRTVGRWTFNQADVIFCYTEADKERVREYGVSSRIEVVSNGIDTERFTPEGPESELIEADGPVLLFVGRLVDGKRPWLVIEALPTVCAMYPGAKLYFCGEGPLQEELEIRARELGVSNSVIFLGHVPYDDMPQVYRSGDVLVLPSRAEGVPRTILEAMASGTSVVTTDLKQLNDVVNNNNNQITSIKSEQDISESVNSVLKRLDSHRQLQHNYNWKNTIKETTIVLKDIVS